MRLQFVLERCPPGLEKVLHVGVQFIKSNEFIFLNVIHEHRGRKLQRELNIGKVFGVLVLPFVNNQLGKPGVLGVQCDNGFLNFFYGCFFIRQHPFNLSDSLLHGRAEIALYPTAFLLGGFSGKLLEQLGPRSAHSDANHKVSDLTANLGDVLAIC